MTRLTVLVSSAHCESRPYGRCAFVLAPRHIEPAADSARLRDSAAWRRRSHFEPEIVYDPKAGATRRR